ncbi:MAG: polysaccharide biosynthesis tyrosine autokinase [Rikenellaceae bacterium]
MNKRVYENLLEPNEERIDAMALLFRYLNNWYYFAISLALVVGAMFLYIKGITPSYEVSASVIIDNNEKSKGASSMVSLEKLGLYSATSSFDNEIEILQSRTLVKDVVMSSVFYINYAKRGLFRNEELYKKSPISIWMTPEEASKLNGGAKLSIHFLGDGKISVVATIKDKNGDIAEHTKSIDRLPNILSTPQGVFNFSEGAVENLEDWTPEDELIVSIDNPIEVARGYSAALSVQPISKTTTIADISFKTTVKEQGVDFINKLVELYNKETNDYKNEVALKTSEFIGERILIINDELGSTEAELEAFKRESNITDLKRDADMALTESNRYQQQIVENSTQLRLVQFLDDYANDPKSEFEVLPINVGLEDDRLSQLIGSYNEMLLERKRLLVTSSESNPMVVNLDASIASMRRNVLTTITSVYRGLLIKQSDIEKEAELFAGQISSTPAKERKLIGMSRQQEIQSTLYLMLLQKREENALMLASTAKNARIFNEPLASVAPISPNKSMYMFVALILGLSIPILALYLKDLFSFKIVSRADVEKITTVPILAEIPICLDAPKEGSIVVHENQNDIMAESFRALRTNMLFMFKKKQRVAMVTSTISGEGKSFVSANLAVSLALMGKKVVVVGLDIRKFGLNRAFGISCNMKGVSNYLANPSMNLLSLIHPSKTTPNLSILAGGTIPPNPTELLSRESLDKAIAILRDHYDYIILDTAPIGVITDTQIIARVADISLYVCRANFSNKSDYSLINELYHNNKIPNVSTVINDVDLSKQLYGSRYGYGAGYKEVNIHSKKNC